MKTILLAVIVTVCVAVLLWSIAEDIRKLSNRKGDGKD